MNQKKLLHVLACGIAGTTASIALAGTSAVTERPVVVNISGATLMQNFIQGLASTNDFLDLDRDGITVSPTVDEGLADFVPTEGAYNSDLWFVVQYRATGSVNGLQELIDFGTGFISGADIGDPTNLSIVPNNPGVALSSDLATFACVNGLAGQFLTAATSPLVGATPGGAFSVGFNSQHPGGSPVNAFGTSPLPAGKNLNSAAPYTNADIAGAGGYRQDLAPLDVPVRWAVTTVGAANATDSPGDPGYGTNPRMPRDNQGNLIGFSEQLVTLGAGFTIDDGPGGAASDQMTVFDTPLAYAPVGTMTNFGTGYRGARYSSLRHLNTTGRTETGENLIQVNRSPGSGTHNAYSNSICTDPSHGIGEAIGGENASRLLGPGYLPSNKFGSSDMEGTLRNTRLGFGYTGAERGTVGGLFLTEMRAEFLAVRSDIVGGTAYARPTILNVLGFTSVDTTFPYTVPPTPIANRYNGYNIGGPGIMATLGDPRSSLNTVTINGVVETAKGVDPANTEAPMRNGYAAEYINNITRSVEAYALDPLTPSNRFTPGEFLGTTLVIAGARNVQQINSMPCSLLVPGDAGFTTPLNFAVIGVTATGNTLANARYGVFGNDGDGLNEINEYNGRTPERQVLTGTNRYSDGRGVSPNNTYVRQSGATAPYQSGTVGLGNRNRISGDFNGDGHRDLNDAEQMVRAWVDRNFARDNTGAVLVPANVWNAPAGSGLLTFYSDGSSFAGDQAIIEVLGDFNCDGDFGRKWDNGSQTFIADYRDALYWADGLGTVPVLDPSTPGTNAPYSGVGDPRLADFENADNPFVPHNRFMNRMRAFMALDAAWEAVRTSPGLNLTSPPTGFVSQPNNFFGVTLARGTYDAGDACADVAGSGARTVGFAPIGGDRVVNGVDLEYVRAQFLRNPNVADGALNWNNLSEAQYAENGAGEIVGEFSCDLTGDGIVDKSDAIKVLSILETTSCDVNLDGVVDSLDQAIIVANQGITAGARFNQGDTDHDGDVDAADLSGCFVVVPVCCPGDSDSSGTVNFADITSTLANFNFVGTIGVQNPGDADCSGTVNFADITAVLANFGIACP
ncbi:MAG: hypothetical protein JNK58_09540 [Phycisphaerae bacterium]|nr:hypothetical protein [Phycisphaerae bacterium]